MNKLFLFCFLIFSGTALAQPIFNSSPSIGLKLIKKQLDVNYISPVSVESLGGNVSWDFEPADILVLSPDTTIVVEPSGVPNANLFPKATFAIQSGSDSSAYYQFFRKTNNLIEFLGESDALGEPPTLLNSGLTVITLPLNYGTTFEDTSSATFESEFGPIQVEFAVNNKAEAWGTIKTSSGTYNCLKLTSRSTTILSLGPLPIGSQTDVRYAFYSPGYPEAIATYTASEVEFGPDIENDTFAFFLVKPTLSGLDPSKVIHLNISPNPAQDYIIVDLGSQNIKNQLINIVDANGKILYQGRVVAPQHRINVNNWPKGTYMVQVIGENNVWGMETIMLK